MVFKHFRQISVHTEISYDPETQYWQGITLSEEALFNCPGCKAMYIERNGMITELRNETRMFEPNTLPGKINL
jgi:hypothetical protein